MVSCVSVFVFGASNADWQVIDRPQRGADVHVRCIEMLGVRKTEGTGSSMRAEIKVHLCKDHARDSGTVHWYLLEDASMLIDEFGEHVRPQLQRLADKIRAPPPKME